MVIWYYQYRSGVPPIEMALLAFTFGAARDMECSYDGCNIEVSAQFWNPSEAAAFRKTVSKFPNTISV